MRFNNMISRDKIKISLITMLILCSCSSMSHLTMTVEEPSAVYVPPYIKNIGFINRNTPAKTSDAVLSALENALSVEGPALDDEGGAQAVSSAYEELMRSARFANLKKFSNDKATNNGMGIFPAGLSWNTVEELAKEKDLDAIIELSFYDTDAKIDADLKKSDSKPFGLKIPIPEYRARITTFIKTGWRFYDVKGKMIRDEIIIPDRVVSEASGINPMNAVEAISGRKEQVKQVSSIIGSNYSKRLIPTFIRVRRDYFVKGTDNFVKAERRARTGNWEGAAELWEMELNNSNPKIAGRANYNMAIINEIRGKLEEALAFASKAYEDYDISEALDYVNILRNRINERDILNQSQN